MTSDPVRHKPSQSELNPFSPTAPLISLLHHIPDDTSNLPLSTQPNLAPPSATPQCPTTSPHPPVPHSRRRSSSWAAKESGRLLWLYGTSRRRSRPTVLLRSAHRLWQKSCEFTLHSHARVESLFAWRACGPWWKFVTCIWNFTGIQAK
ncbi:hypothetical protein BC936DRAFT_147169 [Jimgerdemannia flammicorona]|uniref:Uncharacterized protein n=1 Tax=Jimgerdemannia flammicorona TaxID=994334 RepID=A0A433D5Z8_9FUNG|nr:hypothetical protein BC936DRAFT_147169 [Jimgerdemannia flammicorona]